MQPKSLQISFVNNEAVLCEAQQRMYPNSYLSKKKTGATRHQMKIREVMGEEKGEEGRKFHLGGHNHRLRLQKKSCTCNAEWQWRLQMMRLLL